MTHSSSKLRPRWDINFRLHSARQIATSNLRNNIRGDSHLDMLAVGLDALDEMLNNFIIHFVAQHRIVLRRKNILNLSIEVLKYFLVNYFLPGCNWPGILRTWSWPPIVRGSWKVPNACEAAPKSRNKLNKYQHKLTPHRLQQLYKPGYFDCQDKSSEGRCELDASIRSSEHLLWHQKESEAGQGPPETQLKLHTFN